jgi:hypothetical protein
MNINIDINRNIRNIYNKNIYNKNIYNKYIFIFI